MGVTVHYRLEFKGEESSLLKCLTYIGNIAKDIGFKVEPEPWHVCYEDEFSIDDDRIIPGHRIKDYVWAKQQTSPPIPRRPANMEKWESNKRRSTGYALFMGTPEDCDSMVLGMTRIGIAKKWVGSSFVKTMYSNQYIGFHKKVCAILRVCDEVGILMDVNDESGFWISDDIIDILEAVGHSSKMLLTVNDFIMDVGINQSNTVNHSRKIMNSLPDLQ